MIIIVSENLVNTQGKHWVYLFQKMLCLELRFHTSSETCESYVINHNQEDSFLHLPLPDGSQYFRGTGEARLARFPWCNEFMVALDGSSQGTEAQDISMRNQSRPPIGSYSSPTLNLTWMLDWTLLLNLVSKSTLLKMKSQEGSHNPLGSVANFTFVQRLVFLYVGVDW